LVSLDTIIADIRRRRRRGELFVLLLWPLLWLRLRLWLWFWLWLWLRFYLWLRLWLWPPLRFDHFEITLRVCRNPVRIPDQCLFIAIRIPGLPGRRHNNHRLSRRSRPFSLRVGWVDGKCPIGQLLFALLDNHGSTPSISLSWWTVYVNAPIGCHGSLPRELQDFGVFIIFGIELH
jgi:hypothetical protein